MDRDTHGEDTRQNGRMQVDYDGWRDELAAQQGGEGDVNGVWCRSAIERRRRCQWRE